MSSAYRSRISGSQTANSSFRIGRNSTLTPPSLSRRLVAAEEEGGEGARHRGYDEDRPELEHHVHDPAGGRNRVLQLRGDGQDLHGREEERIAEAVDVAPRQPALERPDQRGAHASP